MSNHRKMPSIESVNPGPSSLDGDPLAVAAAFARTAPSPRNIQPWAFERGEDSIKIFFDRSRNRPVADPYGRELMISCGVVLRYLCLALEACGAGYYANIFPQEDNVDLLADVVLSDQEEMPNQTARELISVAMNRRTNWDGYQAQPIPIDMVADLLDSVASQGSVRASFVTALDVPVVEELIYTANYRQLANPKFIAELRRWPTGRPVTAPESLAEHDTSSTRLIALSTQGDNEDAWLATGQALADLLLKATWLGLSVTFANQPVQLPSTRTELAATLELDADVQQLLRLGYASETAARTPRRSLTELSAPLPERW